MTHRILLVEDDEKLGNQIVEHLTGAGMQAAWLRDGGSAMNVDPNGFALLVLDLMLPRAHGLDVLKRWREKSDLPVLVLSAKSDAAVKVRALELGADDYLTKPFWPEELLARVQARLRRPTLARRDRVDVGPIGLDVEARRLQVDGRDIEVTPVEFTLLLSLARRSGAAVTRAWLVEHVLDPDKEGGERTLDVHVSRLRKKLGAHGALLATVWGVGYRLNEPGARA
ncbi:MAG: response regulator transcription factor [Planctomycetota bacterium]|nr:response regulator transcription factor [Planctomycetota bacterium]